MGKLHTLRRAIERDPRVFMVTYRPLHAPPFGEAKGATRWPSGQWDPYYNYSPWRKLPYSQFVRHVLKQIGYNIR